MPATPDNNPVVLKSEVISPCSSNSSSSDLIVLLDTPVKTRSRTRVVKTQAQKIREYQEKNKDRIATYKKYNHIRSIKLPATPAGLTDNVSELKDLVLELGVHKSHYQRAAKGLKESNHLKCNEVEEYRTALARVRKELAVAEAKLASSQ